MRERDVGSLSSSLVSKWAKDGLTLWAPLGQSEGDDQNDSDEERDELAEDEAVASTSIGAETAIQIKEEVTETVKDASKLPSDEETVEEMLAGNLN